MEKLEIITDIKRWNNILKDNFPMFYDTYVLGEYFELYEKNYDCKKELIYFEDENIKIFFPHLVRSIGNIEGLEQYKNYYDCTTPYGYGGPLLIKKTENYKKSLDLFFDKYKKYGFKKNYITEFIRFHPIYQNQSYFDKVIDIIKINEVIVLDLNNDIDYIWMNLLNGKRRNQIRKEQKIVKSIKIEKNLGENQIKDFLKIYYDTMKKNNAEEKYFFSYKFLKDNFKIGNIILISTFDDKNNILSQSIFFGHGENLHYHLSASNYNIGYGTSSLILWEAIKYGKENGYKYFMLGGGTTGDKKTDNLYKFKKSFGGEDKEFYIGKIIFDEDKYDKINNDIENVSFFPKYRKDFNKLI